MRQTSWDDFPYQGRIPFFFCFFNIPGRILIKVLVIFIIGWINLSAGFCVLMKNIMGGIYLVIADKLVCLPEVAHLVIVPWVEDLTKQIQKVDVKLAAFLFRIFHQLGNINSCRHGSRAFAILRKMTVDSASVIFFFLKLYNSFPSVFLQSFQGIRIVYCNCRKLFKESPVTKKEILPQCYLVPFLPQTK